MDVLLCPRCSLHLFQQPQDKTEKVIMIVSLQSHAAFSVNII